MVIVIKRRKNVLCNNRYEYCLYGYKVISNMKVDILPPFVSTSSVYDELQMSISITNEELLEAWNLEYKVTGDIIHLSIGDNIQYDIYLTKNVINIKARRYIILQASLLNLPFALFFAYRNALLLHASGVLYNNKLFAFSGNKGVGKSTLTSILSKKLCFFSDDTILVKNYEFTRCYPGIQRIKMHEDTYSIYNDSDIHFNEYEKNLQHKAIVNIKNSICGEQLLEAKKLEALFVIYRTEKNSVFINPVKSNIAKKALLHSSICGIDSLGKEFNSIIKHNLVYASLFKSIPIYRLHISNDINSVVDNVNMVITYLKSM